MKRINWIFSLLLAATLSLSAQETIEAFLFDLPDVRFQAIETPTGFGQAYELHIRQPLDHEDPEAGHFYQRVYLSHLDVDRPMVLATEGYTRSKNRMYELTYMLNANQLDVEHRYFGTSVPEEMDYQYLNLKQVTADLHRIRELLGDFYEEDWISTGISKGGQTTIFYRYFYPDDVVASVPYVAPLNLAYADERIYDFLETAGTEECREAIMDYQKRLLKNRKEVLPALKWYARGSGSEFTYLTLEEAFEYGVLEYSFSFWQMGHDCEEIPGKDASMEEMIEHFIDVVGVAFYDDASMSGYASHYYQASTEMGYYGFETEDFKGLLKVLPEEPHASFPPNKMETAFDGTLVRQVSEWLKEEGNRLIYIYGETDTWSATGVPPSDKVDAKWFVLEGADHGKARIRNLPEEEREELLDTLEAWMEKY